MNCAKLFPSKQRNEGERDREGKRESEIAMNVIEAREREIENLLELTATWSVIQVRAVKLIEAMKKHKLDFGFVWENFAFDLGLVVMKSRSAYRPMQRVKLLAVTLKFLFIIFLFTVILFTQSISRKIEKLY